MKVLVVGAGIAGCTATALLKDADHAVTLMYPTDGDFGGLCRDASGYSERGPHALHTDDREIWNFLQRFSGWRHIDHVVYAMTDPGLFEIPRRSDPVFRVYSEKAWGMKWDDLPECITGRVPMLCTDGRTGYHAGRYKGVPENGWSWLMGRMAMGADFLYGEWAPGHVAPSFDAVVYTGSIADYAGRDRFPFVGRTWHFAPGKLPRDVVNYCTHSVPQIRSWNDGVFRDGSGVVGTEFLDPQGTPCYPMPWDGRAEAAAAVVAQAREKGHFLCGRMATYRYLDIDSTIRNVMDTLEEGGLT